MNETDTDAGLPAFTADAAPTADAEASPAPSNEGQADNEPDPGAGSPAGPNIPGPKRRSRGGRSRRQRSPTDANEPLDAQTEPSAAAAASEEAQQPSDNAAQRGNQPRKPNRVLERLFELHPKMFGARFLPLKLGAFQDILALHPDEFKREDLKLALGLHARSTRYLESVASGNSRHDLNGDPVEPVAPEHVHHAILEVFRRRQARTQADLRPQLKGRLIEAIEASGLSREDYSLMAARMQDEVGNAVLDEAFAEIGARIAKREALRRAFEASGKSMEAFAEMYGMDLREVHRLLGSR